MLSQEEFYITHSVLKQIENNSDLYDIQLAMFEFLELNPLLSWTHEILKDYEILWFMLSLEKKEYRFSINSYYHLLHLAANYEDINLNWPSAIELAKEDIHCLFDYYNTKEVIL